MKVTTKQQFPQDFCPSPSRFTGRQKAESQFPQMGELFLTLAEVSTLLAAALPGGLQAAIAPLLAKKVPGMLHRF